MSLLQKSIFIVDDHDIVRFGLETLFKNIPEFNLLGAAVNLAHAVGAIERLQPDLVITDMSLPDSQGLDTVRAIVRAQAPRPVLVLSMHDELIYAEQVMRLGADGYLMKDMAQALIVQVSRALLAGERWVSTKVNGQLLNRLVRQRRSLHGGHHPPPKPTRGAMSMREVEVLEKIGAGKTTKEIAYGLSLSPRTIDVYRASLKKKLGLRSGTELVAFAVSRM